MLATTTAMPAGAAQHKVPGHAARRASPAPARIHIAAGGDHTCGIRVGNTLWCWGWNDNGQLGIGNYVQQDLPKQVTT